MHEDAHYAARETIAKWFYRTSGSVVLTSLLANISALTGALVSLPGIRVCRADETGTLVADRQHVMGHEIFELLPADGGEFHMKSHWDKFVRLGSDSTFDATAEGAKAAARFTVKDLDPNPAEIQKLLRLGTLGNLIG